MNHGGAQNVTTNIPEISPALREWTEKLALNHGSAVNRVYAALMSIKPYADQDSPTKLDTRNSITWSVKLWFDTLLSGSAPSAEEFEAFRDFGRRRVHVTAQTPTTPVLAAKVELLNTALEQQFHQRGCRLVPSWSHAGLCPHAEARRPARSVARAAAA
jgi:hypothetical protein